MPFCVEETKNSTVARFGHKMSKQDVHNIMQITRDEMEVCVSSFILYYVILLVWSGWVVFLLLRYVEILPVAIVCSG